MDRFLKKRPSKKSSAGVGGSKQTTEKEEWDQFVTRMQKLVLNDDNTDAVTELNSTLTAELSTRRRNYVSAQLLLLAASNDRINSLTVLVDILQKNKKGNLLLPEYCSIALTDAINKGNIQTIKYLYENGLCDPPEFQYNDYNIHHVALRQAAEHGRLGVVMYLLDENIVPLNDTPQLQLAFNAAAARGQTNILMYFMNSDNILVKLNNDSALIAAIRNDQVDSVNFFIEYTQEDNTRELTKRIFQIIWSNGLKVPGIMGYMNEKYGEMEVLKFISQSKKPPPNPRPSIIKEEEEEEELKDDDEKDSDSSGDDDASEYSNVGPYERCLKCGGIRS